MNIEEKLSNLEKATIQQAQQECDVIREEYEMKKSQMISKKELEMLSEFYSRIQKEKHKIMKEKNSRILSVSAENKQKLTVKREKMIDEIFEIAESKTRNFTTIELYKEYMKNAVQEAKYVFNDEKVEVILNRKDKELEDYLRSFNEDIVSFSLSLEDIIGGMIFKGTKSGKRYDHSLKALLQYERKNFLKNNKFDI